jgi:hypothetical protein
MPAGVCFWWCPAGDGLGEPTWACVDLVRKMTDTEFFKLGDLHALGTSLIVLGLAFVLSGLVFMLPGGRKRSVSKDHQ